MEAPFAIPNGDETITVELTVKEALALSGGVRFRPQGDPAVSARRKMRRTLERKLLPNAGGSPETSHDA